MARGPYQGTWQAGIRPTVVSSPDALVFINGELDVLGCQQCRRRFDWNRWITSVQVDLNIDSPPGSATINMSVPRHSIDEFYFDGEPLISPMMEVEIFAKGFFLLEGIPQYYPIFWGMVTEVSDSYSGGEHSFSINCADILKWWELCKMNINPAFTAQSGQLGRSIFGNVFFGMNPYDIIWTLAQQAFGDVVVGSGSLVSFNQESGQTQTFSRALSDIMLYWQERFSRIRSNLLLYGSAGNAVRGDLLHASFGNDTGIQGTPKEYDAKKATHKISQAVRTANGGNDGSQLIYDPTDPRVTAFRTQFMNAGQVNFWQSEYQTKLELANAAKESIGFEFFMDVTGDIVFKPPFYNLDVLSNKPVSWIQDIDIIDWDLSESEAEVVTQVQLSGSFGGNVDFGFGEEMTPHSVVTDYHLLRKYGWRTHQFNSEFMGSTKEMFETGVDMLDRLNARRYRGTVNIPMRPELRLGFPIYLAPKDQIWYIQGISHNIQFGQRAQTTLTLTAKRQKFLAPKGIGTMKLTGLSTGGKNPKPITGIPSDQITARQLQRSGQFEVEVGPAAQVPPVNAPETAGADNPYEPLILRHPKTGRVLGFPNVVMAYMRPFGADFVGASASDFDKQLKKVQGERGSDQERPVKKGQSPGPKEAEKQLLEEINRQNTFLAKDGVRDKHAQNRYTYGLTSAGAFVYLHDVQGVVKEVFTTKATSILIPDDNDKAKAAKKNQSGLVRPVSDERGFEVIGHWKYGRGLSLRDGSLVLNQTTGKNEQTGLNSGGIRVGETQLALAGGLIEMLQAQSSGIGTIDTGFPNPAVAVTTLRPEPDLQTAGYINPETKKPEFAPSDTSFIDHGAPLGSPEQQGGINKGSVEASQLSRALTLAEMAFVNSDAMGDIPECDCLLGRAELNFISTGYSVQNLLRAAPEDLPATPPAFGAVAADTGGGVPDSDFVALNAAIENNAPVSNSSVALTLTELSTRVDEYLTNLYRILDDAHQEVEQALRGQTLETADPTTVTPDQIRFGGVDSEGNFAPPFSAPNRGGDLDALGRQGSSAVDSLANLWDDYANKLKCGPQKMLLEGEIAQLEQQIADLNAEIAELEQAVASGNTTIVGQGQSMESRIITLKEKLAEKEQELANKQQELNVLNNEC